MKHILPFLALSAALGFGVLPAQLPQAAVSSPNGGENLLRGSEYTITWSCSHCPPGANLVVEIYNTLHSGPGYSGQISPAGVPMGQGSFIWQEVGKLANGSWLVPGPGYKIHLEAIDGSDASDAAFTILELKLPKIKVERIAIQRLPDCPECVRIDLRPLREAFRGSPGAFRIILLANGRQAADLGLFGGARQGRDSLETRISQPPAAKGRQARHELRLLDLKGRLLQVREVKVDWT